MSLDLCDFLYHDILYEEFTDFCNDYNILKLIKFYLKNSSNITIQ